MMDLSFLKDVKVEAVKKEAKVRVALPKLPENADLRVFGSGRVYPSKAFAEEFNLEFRPKGARTITVEGEEPNVIHDVVLGNGLDIFPSTKWGMIGELPTALMFIAAVPKTESKVDMWASTKYDENVPKASVFTQGASTFSKNILVPTLADIYGINWEEVDYVDLTVARENVIASPTGIYHLPKVVSTGARKGEDTYVRRENITICPLVVSHTELKGTKEEAPKSNLDEALQGNTASEMFEAATPASPAETPATEPSEDWAAKLGAPNAQ